ncbi:3830_t:CDS:2 [Dentiscutata heterogama]|uniref:3830_t:CDS:1 n=1 Tax=Dentiscutata heterogama TaxID=1316150 RepID=A0ACA9L3T8_9GLOM|nr:3830_t:CDS:2 [Dentiscutata heterogama]
MINLIYPATPIPNTSINNVFSHQHHPSTSPPNNAFHQYPKSTPLPNIAYFYPQSMPPPNITSSHQHPQSTHSHNIDSSHQHPQSTSNIASSHQPYHPTQYDYDLLDSAASSIRDIQRIYATMSVNLDQQKHINLTIILTIIYLTNIPLST